MKASEVIFDFLSVGFALPHSVSAETPTCDSFGYYTNMVQQIEFVIHTNIQPLPALFFYPRSSVKGQGHRFKKKIVNTIT